MIIPIKHKITQSTLFECEAKKLKECVENAVESKANLEGANLEGANLDGANLEGANLEGAYLDGIKIKLVGSRPILIIGPIGSRSDWLHIFTTDQGIYIRTGCFFGSEKEFRKALENTHKSNEHSAE